jgi:hypothetical protein
MTNTYLTGNPLGSKAAKDLYDNTSNFDEGLNSLSPSFYDRFNRRRETWAGMEKIVSDFLENMGFEATHLTYVDGSPLIVSRPTQLIDRAGSIYKVKQPASFPVTLTGTWATDSAVLVDVADMALRLDLSNSVDLAKGSTMVGHRINATGAVGQTVRSKLTEFVSVKDFGAVGDGVTDDTAAFQLAVAYATATKNVGVKIPAGLYVISGSLPMSGGYVNVCFYGEGRASRIQWAGAQPMFTCATGIAELSFRDFVVDNTAAPNVLENAIFYFPEGNSQTDFTNVHYLPDLGTSTAGSSFYVCGVGKSNDSVNFVNCYMFVSRAGIRLGAGSSVYVHGGRIVGGFPTLTQSVGIELTGGMGGVWVTGTDIINHLTGVSINQTSGVTNREIFLIEACLDSCNTGLDVSDSSSYVSWTGVWAASCTNANINYTPTSDAAVLNLSGGTIFNAGAMDMVAASQNYGLSINQYGRVMCSGVTFRNNKNRAFSCNSGSRTVLAIIENCVFFSNGTSGRSGSIQAFLAGALTFRNNNMETSVVGNVNVDDPSASLMEISGVRGYRGFALRSGPALGGSSVQVTNTTGQKLIGYLRGGLVQNVLINGTAVYDQGTPVIANLQISLEPGDSYTVVYTSAPNLSWYFA